LYAVNISVLGAWDKKKIS